MGKHIGVGYAFGPTDNRGGACGDRSGSVRAVPRSPGLYAMYGGLPPRTWVAYVGQAGNLAQRLTQHRYRRDSSVTIGVSAVGLNVDHVVQVAWWLHPSVSDENRRTDQYFIDEVEDLLRGDPAGVYQPPRLSDLADRLARIEVRLSKPPAPTATTRYPKRA
jgi:hypothetical protein